MAAAFAPSQPVPSWPGDGVTDRKICFYFVISGHKKKEDLLKTNVKSSKRIEIETAASWHKIEKLENQSSKVKFQNILSRIHFYPSEYFCTLCTEYQPF